MTPEITPALAAAAAHVVYRSPEYRAAEALCVFLRWANGLPGYPCTCPGVQHGQHLFFCSCYPEWPTENVDRRVVARPVVLSPTGLLARILQKA